ncbi:MAG: adenylate/guanylate cyclase domain-containing protein [Acidimicrobiia bacterium]
MGWGASAAGVGEERGRRAVLTVVFTDIDGSTALTERLGDERWVDVLAAHDAAVRAALVAHGGEEVKTTGDGFLAVFGHAGHAVRAAVAACRSVGEVPVPGARGGLRIRVGAHTGAVIRRGGDVLGHNVHLARRITAAARGGEVLVSSSAMAAARGATGVRTGAPRTLRFAGVSEPQVVFGADLAGEAPAAADVVVLHASVRGRTRRRQGPP